MSIEAQKLTEGNRKVYEYDKRRYLFDVKLPAIVAALVTPVALYFAFMGIATPIALGFLFICFYVLFNTLIAKTYPSHVELTNDELVLSSFGRTDTYKLSELTRLQVRENGMTHNAYIRVNGGGLMRGRYFVGCGDLYSQQRERALDLYQFFLDTEARLDPENLRVRSRSISAKKEAQSKTSK